MLTETLELSLRADVIEVWHRGRHCLSLAVIAGRPYIRLVHPSEVAVADHLIPGLAKLDVDITTLEKEKGTIMALPKLTRHKAETRTYKAPRPAKAARDYEHIGLPEVIRDKILADILLSLAVEPAQTKAQTATETRRIAEVYGVTKMQVAGVRAALTRGSHGDVAKLVAKTRRQLHAASVGKS